MNWGMLKTSVLCDENFCTDVWGCVMGEGIKINMNEFEVGIVIFDFSTNLQIQIFDFFYDQKNETTARIQSTTIT